MIFLLSFVFHQAWKKEFLHRCTFITERNKIEHSMKVNKEMHSIFHFKKIVIFHTEKKCSIVSPALLRIEFPGQKTWNEGNGVCQLYRRQTWDVHVSTYFLFYLFFSSLFYSRRRVRDVVERPRLSIFCTQENPSFVSHKPLFGYIFYMIRIIPVYQTFIKLQIKANNVIL